MDFTARSRCVACGPFERLSWLKQRPPSGGRHGRRSLCSRGVPAGEEDGSSENEQRLLCCIVVRSFCALVGLIPASGSAAMLSVPFVHCRLGEEN